METLEARVEAHIRQAVEVFQNLPADVLLHPAPDNGWSIAQCLAHLNSYGAYYLPHIRQGLDHAAKTAPDDTFTSTWLGSYFTRMMNPATGKRKYKAFKNHIPLPDLDAHAVVATFIGQQELLLLCLREARQVNLNIIRIPVSIVSWVRLRLGDVFGFLIAHTERHLQQASRGAP